MATTVTPAFTRTGPGWRYRLESIPLRRLRGFGIALGLALVAGVVTAVNLSAAPARGATEGMLVGRAWTLGEDGFVARLTDWYDHPPLGWLQMALWMTPTGAVSRAPTAVAAGREVMLLALLASAGLLWPLARRFGLARWAASLAVLLFTLSPLGLQLHREVSLENLAVPWVLGAFLLACSPRRLLGASAASGACLAVAVLTSETALLFVPALAWQLWRAGLPSTRRYGMVLAAALFLLVMATYGAGVLLQGELTSAGDHPGLLDGIHAQLLEGTESGSLLTADSPGRRTLELWFDLDPVGLTAMLLAVPVTMLTAPRLRPVAVSVLLVVAVCLIPDHLSRSLVVGLLPFGALLVAGLAQQARRAVGSRPVALAVAAGAVMAVVVPPWVADHRRLLADDADAPFRAAQHWIERNATGPTRLIVDDAMDIDLLEAGLASEALTAYSVLDGDPDVGPRTEGRWSDYRAVVSTPSLRASPDQHPEAWTAVRRSLPLAVFGTGADRVEVRAVVAEGSVSPERFHDHDPGAAARAGRAMARNAALTFSADARRALVAGEVDDRLMTVLVALAVDRRLEVSAFPVDPAEADTGAPRRVVELRTADAADARAVAELLEAQQRPYRPAEIEISRDRLVTVTYPLAALT